MKPTLSAAVLAALLALPGRAAKASDLKGSPASMMRQHAMAVEEDYPFLRTAADVQRLVDAGQLVPVKSTADYTLSGVSFPYTRPEVLSFVQHFAAAYHIATGDRLVITSLTRPLAKQPRNAHALSVHPAGMAVDLRVPRSAEDRQFLENALLSMEKEGLIDVTRELHPSHFHIAVFAPTFAPYAARLDSVTALERASRDARRRAVKVATAGLAADAMPPADGRSLPVVIVGAIMVAGLTGAGVRGAKARRTRITE
jgi:hypothetical protein